MVSVDRVYQTVLTLLNKEQRGFLTLGEFNRLAAQANKEVFEGYFTELGQASARRGGDTADEWANVPKYIREKIELFEETGEMLHEENDNTFETPDALNFWRIGTITYTAEGEYPTIVQELSNKELPYRMKSPLTRPTLERPIYIRESEEELVVGEGRIRRANVIKVYPESITEGLNASYLRIPKDPIWIGTIQGGEAIPVPNQVGYQDFELHTSEEPVLIAKILAYSGIVIRESDIVQAAAQKAQTLVNNRG